MKFKFSILCGFVLALTIQTAQAGETIAQVRFRQYTSTLLNDVFQKYYNKAKHPFDRVVVEKSLKLANSEHSFEAAEAVASCVLDRFLAKVSDDINRGSDPFLPERIVIREVAQTDTVNPSRKYYLGQSGAITDPGTGTAYPNFELKPALVFNVTSNSEGRYECP